MTERGFTLLELIVTMTVMALVAGMVAVFMRAPIDAYVDSSRRAQMTDAADTALRRIARDVRLALPNSVRVDASHRFLEFVPTKDGGRYRELPDPGVSRPYFDFDSIASSGFEMLQPGTPDATVNSDYVVIFNTGQSSTSGCQNGPSGNVYETYGTGASKRGCNRRLITGVNSLVSPAGYALSITPGTTDTISNPLRSPQQRFQIVPGSGPVTYACVGSELRRYTGYRSSTQVWLSQPASTTDLTGATDVALLTDKVSDCRFTYDQLSGSSATSTNALLVLLLKLVSSGEEVSLLHQIHVNNTP